MSSAQESKIPFIILIPFVIVVFMVAMHSGSPQKPDMPGVVIPAAPVFVPAAKVEPVPAASPVAPQVSAPAEASAPAEESWK